MGLGLTTRGEVEDVVGVLTLFGGVMQVSHELLVGLRLLLLHEEEEKEEEQGRQEDREVESGEDQGEETTLDDHDDGVMCGQGSNLSQCEYG